MYKLKHRRGSLRIYALEASPVVEFHFFIAERVRMAQSASS